MTYEEIYGLTAVSDHGHRIVSELMPAIIEALRNTDSEAAAALEFGNLAGGSGIYILWHLHEEHKKETTEKRRFVTVDANPQVALLKEWGEKFSIPTEHHTMSQADFVKEHCGLYKWGFVFFDADHDYPTVSRDVRLIAPYLAKGAVIVIDDVDRWNELPDFTDVGLGRIQYEGVDQGPPVTQTHGQHVAYWLKT